MNFDFCLNSLSNLTACKRKKNVAIAGVSAGLGRAIVRKFARKGDNIALIARRIGGLESAKRDWNILLNAIFAV